MNPIKWILGERAYRTIGAAWNWMWGRAANEGGEMSVAVAEQSVIDMSNAVRQLAEAVGIQQGSYNQAVEKYQGKVREHEQFTQKALIAQQQGNEELAKAAMAKVIAIEGVLPSMEAAVNQAKSLLDTSIGRLEDQRRRLESNRTDLANMKDMAQVNAALKAVADLNPETNMLGAQSDFDRAKQAVLSQGARTNAVLALSEDPNAKLAKELDSLGQDQEIARRLASLSERPVLEGEVTNG